MFHTPSFMEMIVIGAIALLLFGRRLPEVGKNLGRGIVEFKKGLKGIEDEIDTQSSATARPSLQTRLPDEPTQPIAANPGHKFDPYTGKPIDQSSTTSV